MRVLRRIALLAMIAGVSLMAQESAGKSESSEDKLGPWKWANFVILAVGLGYLMGKNLPPLFRSRSAEIQKGIAEAQAMKRDAEKRAAEIDTRVSALGSEIEKFRTQAHTEMQQEGERIRQETVAQIQKVERQSAVEIESAGKTARRELRQYAADLALDLAEQRIRSRMNATTDAALVQNFVADLQQQGSKN